MLRICTAVNGYETAYLTKCQNGIDAMTQAIVIHLNGAGKQLTNEQRQTTLLIDFPMDLDQLWLTVKLAWQNDFNRSLILNLLQHFS